MGKGLSIGLIAIIILLITSVGYFIFQNQKVLKELSKAKGEQKTQTQQTPTSTASTQSAALVQPTPSPALTQIGTQSAIKSHVNSKDYAGLIPYMTTPKVNFSLMSSECCEPQTPQQASEQMKYINSGIPFDFNQQNPTIQNLKAKNPELANSFVGISTSGEQLAAFTIDTQNKISTIQLSVSWKLYSN
ncbi:MAG: hypothetical protein Q8P25_01770 [Candidatus Curtissbacteria bacterium]|nr:hypothetical protein [Candidatus Curtissbacteria bacterium]